MKQPVRSRKPGLATLLALVVVVLTGTIAAQATTGKSQPGMCASIQRLGIEKQMNVHAAQILAACGRVPASSRSSAAQFSSLRLLNPSSPSVYGGPDVNEITGGEGTSPHVTQSETQTWAQGNTVVTTYNDSRTAPNCYSGGSYSTDNGVSFTNLNSRPFCTGHGTGFGDPVVVYDQSHAKWIAVFLASGCGGQGIACLDLARRRAPGVPAHARTAVRATTVSPGPTAPSNTFYGRDVRELEQFQRRRRRHPGDSLG